MLTAAATSSSVDADRLPPRPAASVDNADELTLTMAATAKKRADDAADYARKRAHELANREQTDAELERQMATGIVVDPMLAKMYGVE